MRNNIHSNWINDSARALAGVAKMSNHNLDNPQVDTTQFSNSINQLMTPLINRERDSELLKIQQEKSAKAQAEADTASLKLLDNNLFKNQNEYKQALKDNADLDSMSKFNMPLEQLEQSLNEVAKGKGFSSLLAMEGALKSNSISDTRLNNIKKDVNLLGVLEEYRSIKNNYERTKAGNLDIDDINNLAGTLAAKHPNRSLAEVNNYIATIMNQNSNIGQNLGQIVLDDTAIKRNQGDIVLDSEKGNTKTTNNTNSAGPITNERLNQLGFNARQENSNIISNEVNPTELDEIRQTFDTNIGEVNKAIIDLETRKQNDQKVLKENGFNGGYVPTELYDVNTTGNLFKNVGDKIEEAIKNSKDKEELLSKLEKIQVSKFYNRNSKEKKEQLNKYINLIKDDKIDPLGYTQLQNIDIKKNLDDKTNKIFDTLQNSTNYSFNSQKEIHSNRAELSRQTSNYNSAIKLGKVKVADTNGKPKEMDIISNKEIRENVNKLNSKSKRLFYEMAYALGMNNGTFDSSTGEFDRVLEVIYPIYKEINKKLFTGKEGFSNPNEMLNEALENIKLDGNSLSLNGIDIDGEKLAIAVQKQFAYRTNKDKKGKTVLNLEASSGNQLDKSNIKNILIVRDIASSVYGNNEIFNNMIQ